MNPMSSVFNRFQRCLRKIELFGEPERFVRHIRRVAAPHKQRWFVKLSLSARLRRPVAQLAQRLWFGQQRYIACPTKQRRTVWFVVVARQIRQEEASRDDVWNCHTQRFVYFCASLVLTQIKRIHCLYKIEVHRNVLHTREYNVITQKKFVSFLSLNN